MLRYRSQTSSYFLNSTITSIVFQVLCALTLPVGKWVVDYVLKNHEVSLSYHSPIYFFLKKTVPISVSPYKVDITISGQQQDFHGKVLLCSATCSVWDGTGFWFSLG